MPHYSTFWLAFGNGAPLSPIWLWRDEELRNVAEFAHPLEELPMGAWLRLPDDARAAAVEQYAHRRPRATSIATDHRRGGR
jgi:hypothetical protein